MARIVEYEEEDGSHPFARWFLSLKGHNDYGGDFKITFQERVQSDIMEFECRLADTSGRARGKSSVTRLRQRNPGI